MSVPFPRLFAGRKGKGNRPKECNLSKDFNEICLSKHVQKHSSRPVIDLLDNGIHTA
jgi:hypothetical protein